MGVTATSGKSWKSGRILAFDLTNGQVAIGMLRPWIRPPGGVSPEAVTDKAGGRDLGHIRAAGSRERASFF
jgi:hypothetical protein